MLPAAAAHSTSKHAFALASFAFRLLILHFSLTFGFAIAFAFAFALMVFSRTFNWMFVKKAIASVQFTNLIFIPLFIRLRICASSGALAFLAPVFKRLAY